MEQANILVVGGGIGGLATAIALRQVGFDVHVVERYPDLHSSVFGVGIIQPANALRALDMIGCYQRCLEVGFQAKVWGSAYDIDGNFLADIPGGEIEGYPPMNGVTRPALHEILTTRALGLGVTIQYDSAFESLVQTDDGVDVTLSDGRTLHADVVVGADGVGSRVRKHVLAGDLKPLYTGQSAYRVNIPRDGIDRIMLQPGPKGMAGFVPIGKELAYFFYNALVERDQRPSDDQLAETLRGHLAPFGGRTAKVREEYLDNPDSIVLRPEETLIASAPWHQGRVVLIGDSVHAITPHLGQGAAQAIEDGIVLAECLAKHPDLEGAFAEYVERRFERCKLVVETSLNIGKWETGQLEGFDNVAATDHALRVLAEPL
ncbi:MAG TPA: FAD-dependent oxidoreductase [Propionicimonas sp.]|nr:FAD-dependent oxidoreductase [Propionicimonas sp.]HRA06601.1 FAD-dependent oxidoreductase [Propionicimonas sp.]